MTSLLDAGEAQKLVHVLLGCVFLEALAAALFMARSALDLRSVFERLRLLLGCFLPTFHHLLQGLAGVVGAVRLDGGMLYLAALAPGITRLCIGGKRGGGCA